MFGLSVPATLSIAIAFLLAAVVGEGFVIRGQETTISAKTLEVQTVKADRDAQARAVKVGQGIIDGMRKQWDEADAAAQKTIKSQQATAASLANQLQVTSDQREAYLQQLKEAGHARPIVVSTSVHDGWDPVVAAGMHRLRCDQLAANGVPAADCGLPAQDGAGGPVAPGGSAGTGDYRPTFDQQLQFLADAWRLRDWGASCYADKRAIAASMEPKDPAP